MCRTYGSNYYCLFFLQRIEISRHWRDYNICQGYASAIYNLYKVQQNNQSKANVEICFFR